ncbi:MAG: hypothetical protein GY941_17880 [Planctomycetes bacterium]|nr:hypothetical protein [Planctomycetota bacterium]
MIQDIRKKLSIEDLGVGQVVYIETGVRPIHLCTITYIGKGVGAYIDNFGVEFTFSVRAVNFYSKDEPTQ